MGIDLLIFLNNPSALDSSNRAEISEIRFCQGE